MAILDILGAAIGGGATGLLGTFLGRVAGYFERKEEHKRAKDKWAHDLKLEGLKDARADKDYAHEIELHGLNLKAAQEEFERDIVMRQQEGSFEGLNASLADQTALSLNENGSLWVLDTLRLVRPFLTLLLILLTGVIFFFGNEYDKTSIIKSIVFVTVAAVMWWFGDRAPNQLNNKGGHNAKINS